MLGVVEVLLGVVKVVLGVREVEKGCLKLIKIRLIGVSKDTSVNVGHVDL